ncbi:uncharacterized protein LOC144346238 [Saccoglossus kowalevskii]
MASITAMIMVSIISLVSKANPMTLVVDDTDAMQQNHDWLRVDYPNPQTRIGSLQCGRLSTTRNTSLICDPNGVLDKQQADSLDEFLDAIRELTPCVCPQCNTNHTMPRPGYVVAIAIVNKMDGEYTDQSCPTEKERLQEAEQWADYLLESWKLGSCGNDIVIFVSREDAVISTSTGKKTSEVLFESHILHIRSSSEKYFKSEDYYDGLLYILEAYNRTLVTGNGAHHMPFTDLQLYAIVFFSVFIPFMVFLLVVVMCYSPKSKPRRIQLREEDSEEEIHSFKSGSQRI